jgi:hypothetical protein
MQLSYLDVYSSANNFMENLILQHKERGETLCLHLSEAKNNFPGLSN